MKREELVRSPYYWLANIQSDLYGIIKDYMVKNDLKQKDIADKLGVTKGYVSQILNGDFDHKLSKLVELALAFDKVPKIEFIDVDKFLKQEKARPETPFAPIVQINISIDANTEKEIFVSGNTPVRYFGSSALVSTSDY